MEPRKKSALAATLCISVSVACTGATVGEYSAPGSGGHVAGNGGQGSMSFASRGGNSVALDNQGGAAILPFAGAGSGSAGGGASGSAGAISTGATSGTESTVDCAPGSGECDGNLLQSCETNTLSSPNHCGRCHHSCGGARCTDGLCEPEIVYRSASSRSQLFRGGATLSNGTIYFVEAEHGFGNNSDIAVGQVSSAGVTKILSSDGKCSFTGACKQLPIAVDEKEVFWASQLSGGSIVYFRAIDRTSFQERTVCSGLAGQERLLPTNMVQDSTYLYWWASEPGIWRCLKSGAGQPEAIDTTEAGDIALLHFAGGALFWAHTDTSLYRWIPQSSGKRALDAVASGICGMANDSTQLYYTGCSWPYSTYSLPLSGVGDPQFLFKSSSLQAARLASIDGDGATAVDDKYVYVLEYGKLSRVLKAGGKSEVVGTTLVSGETTQFDFLLGVDTSYVYLQSSTSPAIIARMRKLEG